MQPLRNLSRLRSRLSSDPLCPFQRHRSGTFPCAFPPLMKLPSLFGFLSTSIKLPPFASLRSSSYTEKGRKKERKKERKRGRETERQRQGQRRINCSGIGRYLVPSARRCSTRALRPTGSAVKRAFLAKVRVSFVRVFQRRGTAFFQKRTTKRRTTTKRERERERELWLPPCAERHTEREREAERRWTRWNR